MGDEMKFGDDGDDGDDDRYLNSTQVSPQMWWWWCWFGGLVVSRLVID